MPDGIMSASFCYKAVTPCSFWDKSVQKYDSSHHSMALPGTAGFANGSLFGCGVLYTWVRELHRESAIAPANSSREEHSLWGLSRG